MYSGIPVGRETTTVIGRANPNAAAPGADGRSLLSTTDLLWIRGSLQFVAGKYALRKSTEWSVN